LLPNQRKINSRGPDHHLQEFETSSVKVAVTKMLMPSTNFILVQGNEFNLNIKQLLNRN
jgi:hypothetical protein